jgi:hypothetical protein
MPIGVYVYHLDPTLMDNSPIKEKGTVRLLR